MSRITLLGGSTNRFVLEDGTEGYLEVEKALTKRQVEKGTPVGVVFVPDPNVVVFEAGPGREITPGHSDYRQPEAD